MVKQVYFIQAGEGGPIKIGIAKRLHNRFAEIQTGNHERLEIVATVQGTPANEQWCHRMVEQHWIRGEWFHPHEDVLDLVEKVSSQYWIWPDVEFDEGFCIGRRKAVANLPPHLTTTEDVLDALGGNLMVGRLTNSSPQSVSNWRVRGSFPPPQYLIMKGALAEKGKEAPPRLWGIREPETPPREKVGG